MSFTPIDRLILELAYSTGLLINDKYELFGGITSHSRKQVSVWNAHRNDKQRKALGASQISIVPEELTSDKQTKILQKAWNAGYLNSPKYYDEIATITGKTRKQVCVWCAHRREKIKKEKQRNQKRALQNQANYTNKRQKSGKRKYVRRNHQPTKHKVQGIDADGVSILRTARQGGVLTKKEDVLLVSYLVGATLEDVKRWLKAQNTNSLLVGQTNY